MEHHRSRILLLFFLFSLAVHVRAQYSEVELMRNRMGINVFSYVNRPVVGEEDGYWPVVFHGLIYTRDIGSDYFIRARFDYFQRNHDHSITDDMDLDLYSDIQMGGGWGHAFGDGVVVPYLALDVVMISAVKYSEKGGVAAGEYRKLQTRRLGGAVMPLAGLTFRVTDVLSFSLETNMDLGYTREKGTDFTWDSEGVPREKSVKKNIFFGRWNPVSLLSFELSF